MAELIVEDGSGAVGANSYCSVADADLYMEKRLHTSAWENADDDDKAKALMWATRLLDEQVNWRGLPESEGQPLRWPRSGLYDVEGEAVASDEIPQFLIDATAEFALHLLQEDRTLETNRDLIGLSRIKLDSVEIETDRAQAMMLAKPIIPQSVWSIIRPYGGGYARKRRLVRM